jgi:hypothetical protein
MPWGATLCCSPRQDRRSRRDRRDRGNVTGSVHFRPIVVGGKFSVVKDDATGVLYRMTGAVRIDEQLAPH